MLGAKRDMSSKCLSLGLWKIWLILMLKHKLMLTMLFRQQLPLLSPQR